jgi:membrane associated rhomboid family serine protease
MAYSDRYYARTFSPGGYFPTGVKWLLISNTALWLLYFVAVRSGFAAVFQHFGLVPAQVLHTFAIWQLFTYMFLHDPFGFGHILFNMLTLWMFGADLERSWGTRRFLKFYFLCGVGAGVCVVFANYLFGSPFTRTIGASGAIYGLLMAFGVTYPNTTVLFSFLFPIKAKYFVMIIGAIAFLSSFGANTGVSNVAHLGGMLFGYIYLKTELRRPSSSRSRKFDPVGGLRREFQNWRMQRAKKKFEVYLRKHGGGPWVN